MNHPHLDYLSNKDKELKKIIASIPYPEFESTGDLFHDLMSCILEQQIHYRSSKKTFQKMLHAASIQRLSPDNFEEFEEKALSGVKLSSAKYQTIAQVLEFFESHQVNWEKLNEEEVRKTLSGIRGIGKWTQDMILLFTLGRPDIFPYEDYHLKLIMTNVYQLNASVKLNAQMVPIAEAWVPYRSLAVRYLLAWKDYHKQAIK